MNLYICIIYIKYIYICYIYVYIIFMSVGKFMFCMETCIDSVCRNICLSNKECALNNIDMQP